MITIVRLRGGVRISEDTDRALKLLRLFRENHCVVVKHSKTLDGTLAVVRDYTTFGEVSEEVLKEMVSKRGRKIGICGQAPSDYPEFAQFLVKAGIDSISLNPDSVLETYLYLAQEGR